MERISFRCKKLDKVHAVLTRMMGFKDEFLTRIDQQLQDTHETENIWAQFGQRYLQTGSGVCLFMHQVAISQDEILKSHLNLKSFCFEKDQNILQDFEASNAQIVSEFSKTIEVLLFPQFELIPEFDVILVAENAVQEQTAIEQQIQNEYQEYSYLKVYYDVLNHCFIGNNQTQIQQIFLTLFWTDYLGGNNGQHWGVPKGIFKLLQEKLNIQYELFASPLQHTLSNYFSMLSRDTLFGSLGSFADQYILTEGNFDANPPFVDSLFADFAERILYIVQSQTLKTKECGGLVLFPWKDSAGYQRLLNSEYFIDEIELLKYCHSYVEPATQFPIKAKFDSFFLVIGNSLFSERYKAFPYLADDIVDAFQASNK